MDAHLRELRYFVAVAEELHFTAAAARLFISQPALSKQIRALEQRLGFALFDRQPSGVLLTPQGRTLLPVVREILADWDRVYTEARNVGRTRQLVLGMQTAVGRDLQRQALERFRDRAPDWTVSLRLVGWTDPTAGLADGTSDLAFVWLPVPGDGIDTRVLVSERRWVALPADHRLASLDEIPFAELLHEPFVALPADAGPLRDFWLAVETRDGRRPRIALEATAPDEVFEAVTAGIGIALIAEGNAKLYKRPGVVYRLVPDIGPAELAVAWRTTDDRDIIRLFVDCLTTPLAGEGVDGRGGGRYARPDERCHDPCGGTAGPATQPAECGECATRDGEADAERRQHEERRQ